MNNSQAKHIAAQALKAMQLRRQLDRGELTQEEYLARLTALETTPETAVAPAPPTAPVIAPETPARESPQVLREPQAKLTGALEALQIRRRLEAGQLTRQEYLNELSSEADVSHVVAPKPTPVPATTPTAIPQILAAPALVSTPPPREEIGAVARSTAAVILASMWKLRPQSHRIRWMLAAAGGAFMLVAGLHALAFRGHAGPATNNAAQESVTAPESAPADLMLSEVGFAGSGEGRKIAGVLKNTSGRSYADIRLTFAKIGRDGDTLGVVTATVDHIGGHDVARFEAPDVKSKAGELVLQQMETDAR